MNKENDDMADVYEQLAKLRVPFPAETVEKLPRPKWKNAWQDKRASQCKICNGYHVTENAIHLDYIGHAATTNRLLEVDPLWSWEPMALTPDGLPRFDNQGGLWIKLTVCGVSRLGYGHAGGKSGGDAVKEVIGDAIRNAAMRFGVALDLWSKSDLHADTNLGDGDRKAPEKKPAYVPMNSADERQQTKKAALKVEPVARADNQDALDSLASVCKKYSIETTEAMAMFASDHEGADIRKASSDEIIEFTQGLIADYAAEADPLNESTQPPVGVEELF